MKRRRGTPTIQLGNEPPFKRLGVVDLGQAGFATTGRRAERVRELEERDEADLPDEPPPGYARTGSWR